MNKQNVDALIERLAKDIPYFGCNPNKKTDKSVIRIGDVLEALTIKLDLSNDATAEKPIMDLVYLWICCGLKKSLQEIASCGDETLPLSQVSPMRAETPTERLESPSARALFEFINKTL